MDTAAGTNDEISERGAPLAVWSRAIGADEDSTYLHISPNYCLVRSDIPSPELERYSHVFGSSKIPPGFIAPASGGGDSVIPLCEGDVSAFSRLEDEMSWREAVELLSTPTIEKLLVNGILVGRVGSVDLVGVVAPLMMQLLRGQVASTTIDSCALSRACIAHVARFEHDTFFDSSDRIYRFNSAVLSARSVLAALASEVDAFVENSSISPFTRVNGSSGSAHWHFFRRESGSQVAIAGRPMSKLYVSPVPQDVMQCLQRLVVALPKTEALVWKVGRGSCGMARPDKICVYFSDENAAGKAAAILVSELSGVRAQGVPFTHQHDLAGLVSEGIDPPRDSFGGTSASLASWRLWIAKKIARALQLHKAHRVSLLSTEQFVLWTLLFLGVNPTTWRPTTPVFWRN